MNLSMTQSEIQRLLEVLPASHPERVRLELLIREASTLRVLHEVGLADEADDRVRAHFAKWADSAKVCYPSEADARAASPRTFRDVCTQWGRAGHIDRRYPLTDGRVVRCVGVWWDVPEPGGAETVFFFD